MTGPFEQYPEIHWMKQQMHMSELQLMDKLQQHKKNRKNRIIPKTDHPEAARNGLRTGRKSGIDGQKKSDDSLKEPVVTDKALKEDTADCKEKNIRDREKGLRDETGMSAAETVQVSGKDTGSDGQFISRITDSDLNELQRAILWAEVLGEPVSRKRRRR